MSAIPQRGGFNHPVELSVAAHYFWAGVSFEFPSIAKPGSV